MTENELIRCTQGMLQATDRKDELEEMLIPSYYCTNFREDLERLVKFVDDNYEDILREKKRIPSIEDILERVYEHNDIIYRDLALLELHDSTELDIDNMSVEEFDAVIDQRVLELEDIHSQIVTCYPHDYDTMFQIAFSELKSTLYVNGEDDYMKFSSKVSDSIYELDTAYNPSTIIVDSSQIPLIPSLFESDNFMYLNQDTLVVCAGAC